MKKNKSKKALTKDSKEELNSKAINQSQLNDKNSSGNIDNNNIDTKNINPENNTSQDFLQEKRQEKDKGKERITLYNEFPGFFFKKFNLTTYKKERDDSRERAKSPERIYKLNHKKGNGIPNDLIERLKYLTNIINDEKFQKYYNKRPKGRNIKFDLVANYIINYSKNHNELETLLMVYYFICNEIKCYSKKVREKMKEKYKETENSKFWDIDEENENPKPQKVYFRGMGLSSAAFTNMFEYFLKKLEIKYKHIDGYCKLIENKNEKKMDLLKKKIKFNTTQNFSKSRSKSTSSLEDSAFLPDNIINHSWNAVYVKGEWYFVDAFFGSGGIIKEVPNPQPKIYKSKEKKIFNIFYFMTPPQYLIVTHRPKEDDWQFMEKTVTFSQFFFKKIINYGDFYMGVFQNGVELLSHSSPLIEIKNTDHLKVKLRLIGSVLEGELYNVNSTIKVGEIKLTYEEEEKVYIFEPVFPGLGEFILRINSRSISSTDLVYEPLFDYRIKVTIPLNYLYFEKYKQSKNNENSKVKEKREDNNMLLLPKLNRSTSQFSLQPKIISDYSKILPSKTNKIICYDNHDFHLIEPKTKILRKGATFKFRIKIKGASSVSLLDGNHWTPLRRKEEDIYEGHKEIETDNVSICCLRNKNVYTEVIKFMIHKDRSILSNTVFPSLKKIKKANVKYNK